MPENSGILHTRCVIAGGGPAGMMLGFLLARAGVEVMVLEKHADFLRDFRGDTIHPSTLEVMHELGLLDDFLARPHQKIREIGGAVGTAETVIADFTHLPTTCKFLVLMPQWDFLDFIASHAKHYPTFYLVKQAQVTSLIEENGHVAGVRAVTPDGELVIRADLVVGADGRHSTVLEHARLETMHLGAPMDVLWMRLPRLASDPVNPAGRFGSGTIFVMIYRGDYWQCGYVIPKGGYDDVRRRGLPALREDIATIAPFMRDRLESIASWDDVKLLTVAVERLKHWAKPGLLMIGDAAHAMSPVGGVGINLAIQDAVAAANLLADILRERAPTLHELKSVQHRREFPTRATQWFQVMVQRRVISRVLKSNKPLTPPLIFKLFNWFPILRRIPARLIGMGVRPEHVKSGK